MIAVPGLRVPPGRAGRLWLRRRLAVAEHGVDLLEQKLRLLRTEQARLAARAERTARYWTASSREADLWSLRAGTAGGRRAFRLAEPAEAARLDVRWASVMGVHYPDDVEVEAPHDEGDEAIVGSAALWGARAAHRQALEAGARHAVALASLEIVRAEEATTRRRQRALRKRWIPRLRQALAEVELSLEEQERAEAVRRRWAAGATAGVDPDTPAKEAES